MKKNEVKVLLEKGKISKSIYSLDGGLPNEKLCIDFEHNRWIVYYSERGINTGIVEFLNESDACDYLYNQINAIVTGKVR
ncbi:TPA: hypothetical protein ACIUI8_004605 [Salmonella enterica subsp. enterica serovar Wangata]|uniref:Uncharacterized protein n=1 Tax=Salmonella enterica subsp. enterica serovar Mapo TaxID=2564752 RepID=A0A5H7INB6_SALET|nr:hypothetical protein [Salmonella enterica]EBR7973744.1 hypothetical protein [Salmonella enterica subsp. enterica serovar Enteritidis]EBR8053230.1 hypothetical protein [Salmonella enterica subsp. enterica serovar Altona]EBR9221797.1 hypothetical protein [Salmonella enterica subsp. enterica serovar Wangata]EBU8434884.1 hypothetical protein [Salmonella enterica subsp. enterica serovar Ughelli]EBU9919145.1 hypothetical protein [Salmonella enterica subsp. enterica serovar Weybridge]EBU9962242.1